MIIKEENKKKEKILIGNFFLKFYFFSTTIIAFLVLLLFFNTGYWSNYKDQFLNRLHTSSVINYVKLPEILVKKIFSIRYQVPEINLNISFENIIDLENQRLNALKADEEINNNNPDYNSPNFEDVNAKISFDGEEYQTNIRIKGDRKTHWFEKNAVSYKLSLQGEDKIFGVKRFSLQKPRMRNYIHEWIFFELIGELDLIQIKYFFLNLNINGENNNLYAFEENFDKVLIERNKRRNGPIFSLFENFSMNPLENKFDVYNKKFWLNEDNFEFTQKAIEKLNSFFKSSKNGTDNFDKEKWAKFFAISDLNFYSHSRINKSVRYFYNPVSAQFEPIGYDAHRSVPNFSKHIKNWSEMGIENSLQEALTCKEDLKLCVENQSRTYGNFLAYKFFFTNDGKLNVEFFREYKKWVNYLTSKEFLDNFFEQRDKEINRINSLIYNDYFFTDHNYFYGPGIYYFSKKDIYLRAKNLRNYFKEVPDKVFFEQLDTEIKITNLSYNNLSYIIDEIQCKNFETKNYNNFKLQKPLELGSQSIFLRNTNNQNLICDKVVLLSDEKENKEIDIYQLLDINLALKKIDKNLYKEFFIRNSNELLLKNNQTYINKNILIPKNFTVKILPGQKIILTDNAFIFSKSFWIADGSKNIIEIKGLKDNFGGGIFINDPLNKSLFSNINFKYLGGLKKPFFYNTKKEYLTTISSYNDEINSYSENLNLNPDESILFNLNYNLMGSVNFFNSNVIIENSKFEKICSEDALNIVSSKFKLRNISFNENCSDSIDIDFGDGEIFNSYFSNIGNDALDFSGSSINLKKITLNNVGDKFISVGEESIVDIDNVKGENSFVGIVSKDGSTVTMKNIFLKNTIIGMAAYIKKNEYREGKIFAKNLNLINSRIISLTDNLSEIFINNKKTKNKNENIIDVIYKKDLSLIKEKS